MAPLLRPEEHRVEIGTDDAAPLLLGQLDGAAGMCDAGVVDKCSDRAEGLFCDIEGAHHRRAIAHVRADGDGAAAGLFDARLERGQTIRAARHQRDGGALRRQHLGKTHAETARGTGHQRYAAGEIEQLGCAHAFPFTISSHKAYAAAPSQALARTRAQQARRAE